MPFREFKVALKNSKIKAMKTDLYTKGVLSIIAAALVILVIQNMKLNEVQADPSSFNKFASVPVNDDGSINVKITSDMDVNIHSVGGSSVYGSLPVNLKEVGGSSFYGSLPVNLKEMSGSSLGSNGIPVNIEAVDGMNVYSSLPVKEVK